jgi:hypothetical protein
MKTNPFARGILRIRSIALCLAIVGLVGVEFCACKSLAARYAQYTVAQTGGSQAPSVSLGDLMAAGTIMR